MTLCSTTSCNQDCYIFTVHITHPSPHFQLPTEQRQPQGLRDNPALHPCSDDHVPEVIYQPWQAPEPNLHLRLFTYAVIDYQYRLSIPNDFGNLESYLAGDNQRAYDRPIGIVDRESNGMSATGNYCKLPSPNSRLPVIMSKS